MIPGQESRGRDTLETKLTQVGKEKRMTNNDPSIQMMRGKQTDKEI